MFIISNQPGNGAININNIERFFCTSRNRIAFFYSIIGRKSHYTGSDVPSLYWNYPDESSMLIDYTKIVRDIKLYQERYATITQKVESCS